MKSPFMTVERHEREMREATVRHRERYDAMCKEYESQIADINVLVDEARIFNARLKRPEPGGPLLYTVQAVFDSDVVHHLTSLGIPRAVDTIAKNVYYRVKHELETLAKFNRVPR